MKTGALIVAAGMSTRMKQTKQIMKFGDYTMIERIIRCFYEAGESLKDIQTRVRIFAGGKENRRMKASAKKLCQLIPGSSVEILRGLHHGEFSINYAEQYAEKLRCFIRDKN